ncbi:MAG TPA: ORF6N domain-containing protein [Thermoanaerobaculia bacterium]
MHERIIGAIVEVRHHKVMLDSDLAALYGVTTKALVQAVKRNVERFPPDFMFQLSGDEFANLRSQNVTSSSWGGRRTPPYALTEQGVAMLSSVLRSARAVAVNVEIMRAFVQLRRMVAEHSDLARRIDELEKRYDSNFQVVFEAIRALINPSSTSKKRVGYLCVP